MWEADFETAGDKIAAQDNIVITLAGSEAERRFCGRYNHVGARSDYGRVVDLCFKLGMDEEQTKHYTAYATRTAARLLEVIWYLVEALAVELLRRKALSGPAARRLLRVRPSPQPLASKSARQLCASLRQCQAVLSGVERKKCGEAAEPLTPAAMRVSA